ncbi:MAG: DUF2225 domain-containing protein [Actinomycetota bacterium]|nr:DUF2225 domain-containing protein [Actinomycetota bacterium]
MADFIEKGAACPVCKAPFKALVVKHGSYAVKERDSDFCIHYTGTNPLYYAVWSCPNCGYAALAGEFENTNLRRSTKLVETLKGSILSGQNPDLTGMRTPEMAIKSYLQAIGCAKLSNSDSTAIAGFYLRVAWLYREIGEVDLEKEYMAKSLSLYRDAFENSRTLPVKLGTVGVAYLIGELSRRLGEIEEAVKWFNVAVSHPEAKARMDLEKLARGQWQLAREGYVEETKRKRERINFIGRFLDDAAAALLTKSFLSQTASGSGAAHFEAAIRKYLGVSHAFAVNSWGGALLVILEAIGIAAGDEVILPAMDFWGLTGAILALGAKPLYVDIEPDSLLIDVTKIKDNIGPKVKAVFLTDFAGNPVNLQAARSALEGTGLILIENGRFALGAAGRGVTAGAAADIALFDLSAPSPLDVGDGGLITTNDADLAERIEPLIDLGLGRAKDIWGSEGGLAGFGLQMPLWHSALASLRLTDLDKEIGRRGAKARLFGESLIKMGAYKGIVIPDNATMSWPFYPIRLKGKAKEKGRDWVINFLADNDIEARPLPRPPFESPLLKGKVFDFGGSGFPAAKAAFDEVILLPFHGGVSQQSIGKMSAALKEVLDN